jgi:hypothetical protein
MTAEDVQEQAVKAIEICKSQWPECDHIFIYDNATTHKKCDDGALSARHMPKFTSGTHGSKPQFRVEETVTDEGGNVTEYCSHDRG